MKNHVYKNDITEHTNAKIKLYFNPRFFFMGPERRLPIYQPTQIKPSMTAILNVLFSDVVTSVR